MRDDPRKHLKWLEQELRSSEAVDPYMDETAELLAMAGISLPISADTAYWLFYGLYAAGQLVLYTFGRAKVEVTFAAAYDSLRQTHPQLPGMAENTAE